jgi:hypothetical protein
MAQKAEGGNSNSSAKGSPPAPKPAAAREARLAEALRANLRRRKAASKTGD